MSTIDFIPDLKNPDAKAAFEELVRRHEEEKIRYFHPNPGAQVEFFQKLRKFREVALLGGNKAGKTHCGAKAVVQAALSDRAKFYGLEPFYHNKVDIWVGSVDTKTQREAAQVEIDHFLPKREVKKIWRFQNGAYDKILLENGSTIGFKTYEQGRESWQGPKRKVIWCDEEPPSDIIDEARARLIDEDALLFFTMTPLLGITTVYKDFIEKPTPQRAYIVCPTYENRSHLSDSYFASMESLPEEQRQSRLHGMFVQLGGLVYKEFKRNIHVIPHFEPDPRNFLFYAGMDFGADHPTAFLIAAVDFDGNVFIFREYKQREKDFGTHIRGWRNLSMGYDVKRIFHDPSAKQAKIEFRKEGIRLEPGVRERNIGISLIQTLLSQRKLFVSDQCLQLIYEFEHHQHKPQRNVETKDANVKKVDDDLLDALRYMVAALFRAKAKEVPVGKRLATFKKPSTINW